MRFYIRDLAISLPVAILTGIFWPSIADAAFLKPAVSGGIEVFKLKEIGSSGTRLLSESGNRFVVNAIFDNRDRYDMQSHTLYHLEAGIYLGQVDYDGQSQSIAGPTQNSPFKSKTDYIGGRGEALLGYRFNPTALPVPLDILGGLGTDNWGRHIQDGTTDNGTAVSGITEIYHVYYGKIAAGLTNIFPVSWGNHLQAGLKIPFSISEHVNLQELGYDNDLTLSPGSSYSGFIKLVMEPRPAPGRHGNLLISIYYDGLRFDPSPSKTVGHSGTVVQVLQPETHIDIYGVQIGYRF